ncbi:zinc finger E-box-binding homeobox 2 [Engraulis encrasicolus]|uniref:zinc finger E-box-binding homeobox 2 n=1 Tax=Engraulis encrasicolus TaxID=184585 RepID=UPI002FD5C391
MESNSCLADTSHAEIQMMGKDEGSSDVADKSPVLGQNLSPHGMRSLNDPEPTDANPAMPIKKEKEEEVVVGCNDSLITSTQGLEKKVKIEPLTTTESLMLESQNQKNQATESYSEALHLFPWKGKTIYDYKADDTVEVLDLSLPKRKRERSFRDRCVWITGDDGTCESSLVMEVDEIDEVRSGPEVEDDDDEGNDVDSPWEVEDMQWGDMAVPDQASLSPPLGGAAAAADDDEEMLLIDIEGVPYTLTPDGTKIPQPDSEELTEQADTATATIDNDQPCSSSSSSALTERAQSEQNALHSSVSLDKMSSDGATANIQYAAFQSNPVLSNMSQLSVLPALSGLSSQPIHVMANSTSNTPILLLPSSQLQASCSTSSSASETKTTGLMALSLPIGLAQNPQSSQMFFVLSSLPVSSTQTSATQLPVLAAASSGQLSQISQIASMSSVALPLTTTSLSGVGSTVVASNPPLVNLLVPEPQCSTVSGSDKLVGNPSPSAASTAATASPIGTSHVSSTSLSRQGTSDKSDSWMPKSFREALLRPTSSPEYVTAQPPDTQTQGSEFLSASSSPAKRPRHLPSALSSDVSDRHSPKVQPFPKAEPGSVVPNLENMLDFRLASHDEQLVTSSSPTPPPLSPSGSVGLSSANQLPSEAGGSPSSDPNSGPRRILYCPYCPRVFYYLSDLERHSITHSQSKPHVCPLCGKAFKRSSHLERHKHIHTGQRNFVCAICSKRFREAGELMRHQRVHTGEKPYQCSLCHMRFAERNTLRRHTKRKHQGREQEAMDADGGRGGGGGTASSSQTMVLVEQEESAEWYSSEVPEQYSEEEEGYGEVEGDGEVEGEVDREREEGKDGEEEVVKDGE